MKSRTAPARPNKTLVENLNTTVPGLRGKLPVTRTGTDAKERT
jgi:hypothetical protein